MHWKLLEVVVLLPVFDSPQPIFSFKFIFNFSSVVSSPHKYSTFVNLITFVAKIHKQNILRFILQIHVQICYANVLLDWQRLNSFFPLDPKDNHGELLYILKNNCRSFWNYFLIYFFLSHPSASQMPIPSHSLPFLSGRKQWNLKNSLYCRCCFKKKKVVGKKINILSSSILSADKIKHKLGLYTWS